MGNLVVGMLIGAIAGAIGGAILGVGESALVTWTSAAAEEYWLFLFGALAYGIVCAAFGLVAAGGWGVLRRGRAGHFELAQVGAGLGFVLPALFVTRYHVAKRIFNEQLGFGTFADVVAHVLIVLGVAVAAFLVVGIVRVLIRRLGMAGPALGTAALAAIAVVIGAVAGSDAEAAPHRVATGDRERPNVILILADTLRADTAMEQARRAPDGGLARLHRDGVVFDSAWAQASWTRPSVASILTGQYPSTHGTTGKLDFMSNRVQTLAKVLRDSGYWTSGVTTNINVSPIFNLHQGFAEFAYLEPAFYFGATDSGAKLVIYKTLRALREKFFANRVHYQHFYQDAEVVNERVRNWLSENPPSPFLLFVHYMDPHDPYFELPYNGRGVARVTNPSPAPERADELRSLYVQGVEYLDQYLARLIADLEKSGAWDRSVVVFVSDHGEEFHEHDGWWHGTTLYDEQLHVPLVVKLPQNARAGERRSDVARTIDIAPSVLGALGMRAQAEFQGVDLMATTVDEPVIAEEDLEGNRLFAIRDGEWKLIIANPGNPRGLAPSELYDIARDPGERNNVAASHPEKVAELEARLRSMLPPGTL